MGSGVLSAIFAKELADLEIRMLQLLPESETQIATISKLKRTIAFKYYGIAIHIVIIVVCGYQLGVYARKYDVDRLNGNGSK